MNYIHQRLCNLMANAIMGPLYIFHGQHPASDSNGIPEFLIGFGLDQHFGVNPGERRRWRTPDNTILGKRMAPTLVVEVCYSHPSSRQDMEKRYLSYFSDFQHIKVVLCLDIYYDRGPNRAAKTSQHLNCSAISMWALQDG